MTSTSASPPRLVVVAPVDRKFTNNDWCPRSSPPPTPPPLLSTCPINNVSLKRPESLPPRPALLHSSPTVTLKTKTDPHDNYVDVAPATDDGGTTDCKSNGNGNDSIAAKNDCCPLETNCNEVGVDTRATLVDKLDDSDIDNDDERLIINEYEEDEDYDDSRDVIEPLIIAKRKKSKRRRWILSRKPKCISRTQRIIYPPKLSSTNNNNNANNSRHHHHHHHGSSKRKLDVNGLDAEASDDQDQQSSPSSGHPSNKKIVASTSKKYLEPVIVHSSVFLPRKCRVHLNDDDKDDDDDDASTSCLQTELMKSLLPHLHTVLSSSNLDDVSRWSLDDVAQFIRTIPVYGGLVASEKLADKFKDELIDGEALLLLTQNDLIKQMNIKLGPALKIYSSVLCIKHERSKRKIFKF